jgi:hypothetical protein
VYVAVNQLTVNGQLSNMEAVTFADPLSGVSASVTAAGTGGTNAAAIQGVAGGVAVPVTFSSTVGIQGVTNGTPVAIQGVNGGIPVSTNNGGTSSVITNLSGDSLSSPLYLKNTPGRIAKLIFSGLTALANGNYVTVIDQASGSAVATNVIQNIQFGASQIVTLDYPTNTGIGVYLTGSLGSGNTVAISWS